MDPISYGVRRGDELWEAGSSARKQEHVAPSLPSSAQVHIPKLTENNARRTIRRGEESLMGAPMGRPGDGASRHGAPGGG